MFPETIGAFVETLVSVLKYRPKVEQKNVLSLSEDNYAEWEDESEEWMVSKKNQPHFYDYVSLPANLSESKLTFSYWDLGSFLCSSPYDQLCSRFIKYPSQGCSGPGCGVGSWLDTNSQCHNVTELIQLQNSEELRRNRTFVWPHSLYNQQIVCQHSNTTQNCQ